MKWIYYDEEPIDAGLQNELKNELGLPEYIIQIFLNRGINSIEKAKEIFNIDDAGLYSPFLLDGMEKAVDRVVQAVKNNEKIVIYGDYDVDGVTSTVIMHTFFKDDLKYDNIDFYVPDRHEEGYGLNKDALKGLIEKGTNLIITVDCGITSKNEVDFCNESGVEVIITDHHTIDESLLPDKAYAVINPKLSPEYPNKDLSGVGVAYKFICGISERMKIDIKNSYLDFTALGTIADIVPLSKENRLIVRKGLKELEKPKNEGLRVLKEVSGLKAGAPVNTYHVGFVLGPRINAAGRLEHARNAIELFISHDSAAIEDIAGELNETNEERKKLMKKMEEQAIEKLEGTFKPEDDFVIVLYDKNWNTGIVGLVASKVLNKFNRPTFILTMNEDGMVHGSARSIPGVNIYDSLKEVEDLLEQYGGHKLAAGVTMKEENIDKFRKSLNDNLKKKLSIQDFEPEIKIDAIVNEIMDIKHIEIFSKLQPWGEGNPKPVFAFEKVSILDVKYFKNNTLKFYGEHGGRRYNFILFGHTDEQKDMVNKGEILDIAFTPSINVWQDVESLSLEVKDIKS